MNTIKTVLLVAAMFLAVGGASAETSTIVKSVTGDKVQVPKDTECFVRERTLFGNGGASPLSGLFADGGLTVVGDTKARCSIVVGGEVTLILNKDNPTFISPILADWIMENPDVAPEADAAISDKSSDQLASHANVADKLIGTVGETAGAAVGATFGLAGAVGGAMLGALVDEKKKQMPAGVASIYADLKFEDANGKVSKMIVVVHAASTTKERPADLLRSAVKRVVAEIQANQDVASNTSASASVSVTTKDIH
jgi:hypothetical protein